jgi:hypothetical protein
MLNAATHGLPGRSKPVPFRNGEDANHHLPVLRLPQYRGRQWIRANLPSECEAWSVETEWTHAGRFNEPEISCPWQWPSEQVFFFGDPHADPEAFMASLVASGGIEKTGKRDEAFRLTDAGRSALFILAGDCFDKGPENLRLLRILRLLMDQGACMHVLAGNHDVRTLLGMRSVNPLLRVTSNEHFFIRMGAKVIPVLLEIHKQYIAGCNALRNVPGTDECRRRLYPSNTWYEIFPELARKIMPAQSVERELVRLKRKLDSFEDDCNAAGLTLRHVYAATLKWQSLFLRPEGEFYWFFRTLQLAYQNGSFLFIHAGLDDRVAEAIDTYGIRYINRQFRKQLQGDAISLYYGPIGNCFRTKYREVDMPFTRKGAESAQHAGIHVVVHGHRNVLHGQHITRRHGLIDFECDTTMDHNSRKKEGLNGPGAGVTIIKPDGVVMGISTDYPRIKLYSQDGKIPGISM